MNGIINVYKEKGYTSHDVVVSWAAVKQRETLFHDWFWTRQGRLGKNKAITAVSRKMLKLIYTLISSNTLYNNVIALSNVNH